MSQDVVLEMFYPHPPERVWQAITDRQTLSVWMMNNDFEARLGHQFRFHSSPLPGLEVTIECQVLEVEAPNRLVYSWKAHPLDEASRVIWTLSAVEGGTQVRLQHRAIESAVMPGWGIPVPDRSGGMAIDAQFAAATLAISAEQHALIASLPARASSKIGFDRPSAVLSYQTNWHYWLQQKLPEVFARSSL